MQVKNSFIKLTNKSHGNSGYHSKGTTDSIKANVISDGKLVLDCSALFI